MIPHQNKINLAGSRCSGRNGKISADVVVKSGAHLASLILCPSVYSPLHCCLNCVILSEAKNLCPSRFFGASRLRMTNIIPYLKVISPSVSTMLIWTRVSPLVRQWSIKFFSQGELSSKKQIDILCACYPALDLGRHPAGHS
jgi:hypothetical protein